MADALSATSLHWSTVASRGTQESDHDRPVQETVSQQQQQRVSVASSNANERDSQICIVQENTQHQQRVSVVSQATTNQSESQYVEFNAPPSHLVLQWQRRRRNKILKKRLGVGVITLGLVTFCASVLVLILPNWPVGSGLFGFSCLLLVAGFGLKFERASSLDDAIQRYVLRERRLLTTISGSTGPPRPNDVIDPLTNDVIGPRTNVVIGPRTSDVMREGGFSDSPPSYLNVIINPDLSTPRVYDDTDGTGECIEKGELPTYKEAIKLEPDKDARENA
uniref:Uncharacterized LOC100180535 n=1 Tax=Ciona intestinalis TaxID=7719 RepID=F6RXA8_CIOIN|nr:uncharacterized protein LOC100180535 [Ciona intestinalis]|eukprot:XP_002121321.1 uncharacterized protein LOC100180535 [Ciona intestinalis]